MPKSKKPKLALVEGGVKSFEDYKRMMNALSQSLLGHPMSASDEEWKRRYAEFIKEPSKNKGDGKDRSK